MPAQAINYYRTRRPGPELELEDTFLADTSGVLDCSKRWWFGGSLPLGAGLPDFLAVHYDGSLGSLEELGQESVEVLAYLRSVTHARLETVAERLQYPMDVTETTAGLLSHMGALESAGGNLTLTPTWRDVLPEVVAVEFKVSDWRRALSQATRNLLFAHRSFVAFPVEVAMRVRSAPEFARYGVGVLALSDERPVTIVRRERRSRPRSWRYYYELASHLVSSGV